LRSLTFAYSSCSNLKIYLLKCCCSLSVMFSWYSVHDTISIVNIKLFESIALQNQNNISPCTEKFSNLFTVSSNFYTTYPKISKIPIKDFDTFFCSIVFSCETNHTNNCPYRAFARLSLNSGAYKSKFTLIII
jgi:hypothetical protein